MIEPKWKSLDPWLLQLWYGTRRRSRGSVSWNREGRFLKNQSLRLMALTESYISISGATVGKEGSGWETRNCGFTSSESFGVIICGDPKHMCRVTVSSFFVVVGFFKYLFIYLVLAVLGLRCCAQAFSSCSAWASHCGGFSCCGAQTLGAQSSVVVACGLSSCGSQALEHRLSSCGSQAQLLRGMWDLPGPEIEPVSPALAGGFLTTAPPGKSYCFFFTFSFVYGSFKLLFTVNQVQKLVYTDDSVRIFPCGLYLL